MFKSKLTIKIDKDDFYDGGDAQTPPMGWSSWNTFRNNIDEKLIYDTAVALKESGLADAGYRYVNLDDCWHSSQRDENGCLQGDLARFSSGIQNLTERINSLGLRVGLYSSNGDYTCEDLPASLGNEKLDAETFADWGIEYFKYDFCHNIKIPSAAPLLEKIEIKTGSGIINLTADDAKLSGLARVCKNKRLETGKYIGFLGHGKGRAEYSFNSDENGIFPLTLVVQKQGRYEKYVVIKVNDRYYEMFIPYTKAWTITGRYQCKIQLQKGENRITVFNPVCTRADSAYIQYKRMGEALKNASGGEKKITYSICEWGRNKPENWAWNAGNLWRTTADIRPIWPWINVIYNKNLKLSAFAGPGHWNDPDMLEVGNGKLTFEENKSHFSLWCMMSAPLILGNDIRKFKDNPDDPVLKLLKNEKMIEIDQDKLGFQGVRFKQTSKADYIVKKLNDGGHAVCIFNRSSKKQRINFSISDLPFDINSKGIYTEVWSNTDYTTDNIKLDIEAHDCVVLVEK